ncbi:MAG: hypothetical protein U0640_13425 [Phycisphaerales bacterium]
MKTPTPQPVSRAAGESSASAAVTARDRVVVPPGTPAWITPDLVELTLKVWQKHYDKPLSIQDAVTIVLNAGQMFGALARE